MKKYTQTLKYQGDLRKYDGFKKTAREHKTPLPISMDRTYWIPMLVYRNEKERCTGLVFHLNIWSILDWSSSRFVKKEKLCAFTQWSNIKCACNKYWHRAHKIRQPLIIIGMKRAIQIECDESATFHGTKGEYKRNKLMNWCSIKCDGAVTCMEQYCYVKRNWLSALLEYRS